MSDPIDWEKNNAFRKGREAAKDNRQDGSDLGGGANRRFRRCHKNSMAARKWGLQVWRPR